MLNPISEENICGVDMKYDDLYLAIEQEISNENSLTNTNKINWEFVGINSQILLTKQTKDIKLFCWWAIASIKHDLNTTFSILELMNQFITMFHNKLFPTTIKARISIFNWFDSNLEKTIILDNKLAFTTDDLTNLQEILNSIQNSINDLTNTQYTYFKNLLTILTNMQKQQSNLVQITQITTPNTQQTKPINTQNIDYINNDYDFKKSLNVFKKLSNEIIQYLHNTDSYSLMAIKLTRMLCWLEIDETPKSVNNKTLIKAPSQTRLDEIDELLNNSNLEEAFLLIETTLSRAPFWLDGHKKSYDILKQENKLQSTKEIKNHILSFVNTYDNILDLTFDDNTPFASHETIKWLNISLQPVKNETTNSKDIEIVDDLKNFKNKCYAYIKQKNPKQAFLEIETKIKTADNYEDKFLLKILHIEVAIEASLPHLALAIIEELYHDIEYFKLEKWKPELASKVYLILLKSFNRTQISKERFDDAYYKLSKINSTMILDIKF
ncbi:type VI secretion system protein TssA [Arcobacter sp. FWKO B]|uniref:type VI secretion system protein TssA n=1 Tax=Arcobacter sp. FWKO B TaxID=2593672 RepID=UPI0018A39F20|nr:type VI secretion system protein TssA [Arcobacter sp. FWKO B]QOG11547.1 type VI secretion system protein TssA [Arcobacter sp. FWKO B]